MPRAQLPRSQRSVMPWADAAGEARGCRQRVTPWVAVLRGLPFAPRHQSFTCPSPSLQPPAGRRDVRAGGVSAPTEPLAAPFPTALWLLYLLRAPLWWVPVQGWEGSPVPPGGGGGGGGGGVGRGQPGALPDVGKEKAGGTLSSVLPLSKERGPRPSGRRRRRRRSAAVGPKGGEGARLGPSIPTRVPPRRGRGGSGPPGAPRSASLHPPHCSRPGGREEEQGQGPACGRRPALRGRQEGSAGSVPPEPLACWSRCSSGLPVRPCSSRAGRPGCTPGGRSRPALPWRGSLPPLFLTPVPAAPGDGGARRRAHVRPVHRRDPRGLPLPTSPSRPEMRLRRPSVPPRPAAVPCPPYPRAPPPSDPSRPHRLLASAGLGAG